MSTPFPKRKPLKVNMQKENASIEEKSERKVHELTYGQLYADSREVEAAVPEKFPSKPVPIEFRSDFENITADFSEKKRPPITRKTN